MFLHSGASLHGHEYSHRPAQAASVQALNRRSPLLRSPFVPPRARTTTPSPAPEPAAAYHPTPSLQPCGPQRTPRYFRRSTPEPIVRFQEPAAIEIDLKTEVKSLAPSVGATGSAQLSEEEGSCSEFEASDTGTAPRTGERRRRKQKRQRVPRKTNTYYFAHPPPRLVKKRLMKQIRPRLLLQLHQLSVDQRPKPIFDVFPASTIAGPVLGGRFAKRFPRIFSVLGDKCELGSQDVILFRSEEYSDPNRDDSGWGSEREDSTAESDDNLNHRDLVAVLSPLRREDRTEIVLDDGTIWVAEPLPSGSFEFTHTDASGNVTVARWVRRSLAKGATSPISPPREIAAGLNHLAHSESAAVSPASLGSPCNGGSPLSPPSEEYRYTFSMIDPQSRRHPIMATLTQSSLDILENYTTVSASAAKYPPCRPFRNSFGGGAALAGGDDDEDSDDLAGTPRQERRSCPVDEPTKNLISIAAVWVTLRLGGVMPSSAASEQSRSFHRSRTHSITSTPTTLQKGVSSNTFPTTSSIPAPQHQRISSFGPSPNSPRSPADARSLIPLPRRATSTGAAFMQRRMAMSDVSDTERASPVPAGLRSKGRRVFSGDWGVSWKRNSAHIVEAEIPTPSSQNVMSTATVSGADTPSSSRPSSGRRENHPPSSTPQAQERKAISAYYATGPPYMTVGTDELNSGGVTLGLGPSPASPMDGGATLAPNGNSRQIGAGGLYIGGHFGGHGGGVYIGGHFGGGGGGHGHGHGGLGAETDAENAGRSDNKWRRLSHWIRRFGH